jgi:hypothetical protein
VEINFGRESNIKILKGALGDFIKIIASSPPYVVGWTRLESWKVFCRGDSDWSNWMKIRGT